MTKNFRSKYGNKKVTYKGMTFDSIKERDRWIELDFMQQAGRIWDLKRQVRFTVIPAQYIDGKCVEKACTYVADFVYRDERGLIVEDCKGFKTEVYKIKRKLMLKEKGIRVRET